MNEFQAKEAVEEIMSLYINHGNEDYIGEPVSQIEHMCQCAQLAEEAGAGEEMILAAFFHDIGHLYAFAYPEKELQHMDDCGIVDHEKLGADYLLQKGFNSKIACLVASHVDAKRYLTYKYPEYRNKLSPASKVTLEHQDGAMSEKEALSFEADELFNEYITLRKWDELAKEMNKPLPDLEKYRKMMERQLNSY